MSLVEEFRDLVRILEERPEWRAELRRLVLTEELLPLPAQLAVVGKRLIAEAAELARTKQVWQIMNGYALAPEPVASPS